MTTALEGGEWSAARPGRTLPPGKDPVPILQEAGWAPGPVWMGRKPRLHRDSITDRPAHSRSLYRLSYPAHKYNMYKVKLLLLLHLVVETFIHVTVYVELSCVHLNPKCIRSLCLCCVMCLEPAVSCSKLKTLT